MYREGPDWTEPQRGALGALGQTLGSQSTAGGERLGPRALGPRVAR